jgi:hypothetical protein
MAKIDETKQVVTDFLTATLKGKDIKVIRVAKTESGWEADAEVYEESAFIKALGLPTRVQDRNVYTVKLDENLEVQAYERKGQEG